MTSTDWNRLLKLERLFREGATLSASEAWELERLRDEAGQGDMFEAEIPAGNAPTDDQLIDRDIIAEKADAPLQGFDAGEQADAFGQQLLL